MKKVITQKQVKKAVEDATSVIKALQEIGVPTDNLHYMSEYADVAINLLENGYQKSARDLLNAINEDSKIYEEDFIFYLNPKKDYKIDAILEDEDEVINFVCNHKPFNVVLCTEEELREITSQCGGRILNIVEEVERLVDDHDLKWHFVQLGQLKEQAKNELDGGDYITAMDIINCIRVVDDDSIMNPLANNEWVFFDTMSGQCSLLEDDTDIINALKEYYEL